MFNSIVMPNILYYMGVFIVRYYIGPAVLEITDPNQYDAIPKSSTTHALISMIHTWASATDGKKLSDLFPKNCPLIY
jgi:hypothetical protein